MLIGGYAGNKKKGDGEMRNSDGTFAGAGTRWAFYEEYEENEDLYQNHSVHVRLPYDYLTKEERAELNGPVKVYFTKGRK